MSAEKKRSVVNTAVISIQTENAQPVQYLISEEVESSDDDFDDDYKPCAKEMILEERIELADDYELLSENKKRRRQRLKIEQNNSKDDNDVELVEVAEDEIDISDEEQEIVVEHVCGKCNTTFDDIESLRLHMSECRKKAKTSALATDTKKEAVNIADETAKALQSKHELFNKLNEKNKYPKKRKILCFCCDEEKPSCHTGDIPCRQCPLSFSSLLSLEKHNFSLHSASLDFLCTKCEARCPSSGILDLHMQTSHSAVKPFACEKCGRTFTRKYHLERHLQHTDCDETVKKVAHKCDVCEKKFNRLDNLREHLRIHMGQPGRSRDYQCPYCEKSFYGSSMLNIHIRTHTGEKPFPCDLCEKSFSSTGALRKHRRVHTGEKPYSCSVCFAAFSAKETLNRHFKTHTGVKPHTCDICNKSFIQATQLKAHRFYHTGDNGYKCPHCNKQFNRPLRLKQHISYVHDASNESLKCTKCGRQFYSITPYNKHLKFNCKPEEFKCDVCGKLFFTKYTLISHLRVHRLEEPSICAICEKQFIRFDCYVRHLKKKHSDIPFNMVRMDDDSNAFRIVMGTELEEIQKNNPDRLEYNGKDRSDQVSVISGGEDDAGADDCNDKNANDGGESSDENIVFMGDDVLKKSIGDLLNFLVDEETLTSFGWPDASVEEVLSAVIKQCGHTPADYKDCRDYTTKMRENTKLLFTVVIDDDSIKALLNNHTIDEVILKVLKMAKAADD